MWGVLGIGLVIVGVIVVIAAVTFLYILAQEFNH